MEQLYRGRPRRPRFDFFERLYELRKRLGLTGKLALAALLLIALVTTVVEVAASNDDEEALRAYVKKGEDPVRFIADRARSHKIMLLGDIPGAAAPKRLAARAIEAVALGSGLDALVLEVPSTEQGVIDTYLNTRPEDAALLTGHPELLREWAGDAEGYLSIYRAVWRINQKLGPERSIRIVAAGLPDWPPRPGISPRAAAETDARRADYLALTVRRSVIGPFPRARIMVFIEGYQVLKGDGGLIQSGGSSPVRVPWAAARMTAGFPAETYSILVEGATSSTNPGRFPTYDATRFLDVLGNAGPAAVPADEHFDFIANPIRENGGVGIEISILPRGYRLGDVVDAYVILGAG